MLRLIVILSIFTLLFSTHVSAQRYSYSFSGPVKDSAVLVSKIQNIEWVQKCKLYIKPEKPGGVILFRIKPYEKTYDKEGNLINPSPLQKIKDQILKEGLEPKDLIRLKD